MVRMYGLIRLAKIRVQKDRTAVFQTYPLNMATIELLKEIKRVRSLCYPLGPFFHPSFTAKTQIFAFRMTNH